MSRARLAEQSTESRITDWLELTNELGIDPHEAASRVGMRLDTIQKRIEREGAN